jgi:hypothetical protein
MNYDSKFDGVIFNVFMFGIFLGALIGMFLMVWQNTMKPTSGRGR